MKKKILILLGLLGLPVCLTAAPHVVVPSVKSPTTFAVFVDARSYREAQTEIDAYRAVLEQERLGTYLLVEEWASPEAVREEIVRLKNSRSPIEGAVFIGDIPIPMIRDAQHLTSAFKADQQRDWKSTSVPSDRFYDDLDLQFDFLKRDADQPLYFYYSLSPASPQYISSDLYTARIRPPHREGCDRYALLRAYLQKVVKAHTEENVLDNMLVFRGHGYNSESSEAWMGEQFSLGEQLPRLFQPHHSIRFIDFEDRWPMKPYLLEKMEQPDVDVALCHHHGAPDVQYFNGYLNASDVKTSIENIRLYLRSKLDGNDEYEQTKSYFMSRWGVPEAWCEVSDSLRVADSIYNYALDLHVEELHTRRMNPRFVMLDACFNGSFHLDDCVASSYIFGEGNTLIVQGNSVNALQDKWPDRYIGLLDCGVRVGQWGRHVHYLETHLIGDPTYRFANRSLPDTDLGTNLVTRCGDTKYWLRLADDASPADVEAMALRRLGECGYAHYDELLYDRFCRSKYAAVRLEALTLMRNGLSEHFVDALHRAAADPYELTRRLSALWMGQCGDERLIPSVVESQIGENISRRVAFQTQEAVPLFNRSKISEEFKRRYAAKPYLYEGEKRLSLMLRNIEKSAQRLDETAAKVADTALSLSRRVREIRYFRNYNHHERVPWLLGIAEDASQPEELRVAVLEALGWFRTSWQRSNIRHCCERLVGSDAPEAVRAEAEKTLNRLKPF